MPNPETSTLDDAVKELISTYQELNPSTVEELHEPPTPLEFMRYVHKGRPFVVRGAVSHWPAATQWTVEYLKEVMRETAIQVAVTPSGLVSGNVFY
jgi:peptidyl-lysine (3S)-dioxygenase / protease